jgi:hypothetical protein
LYRYKGLLDIFEIYDRNTNAGSVVLMATIFANPVSDAKRTWVEYTDIDNDTLKSWKSITQAAGFQIHLEVRNARRKKI